LKDRAGPVGTTPKTSGHELDDRNVFQRKTLEPAALHGLAGAVLQALGVV
jgi:hypothetical protein